MQNITNATRKVIAEVTQAIILQLAMASAGLFPPIECPTVVTVASESP